MPLPRRMETSTSATPEVASEYVPQRPEGAQPAFQPAALYVPAEAGKATVEEGAVASTSKVRLDGLSTLPTASVARTRTV